MNKLQEIFSYSATSAMDRGWTHQGEGGKLKNWDPEIGDEPKPWIKHHLSFKQGLLVERILFVNLCWNNHWQDTFPSDRHYILKEKEIKIKCQRTDSLLSGCQHTSGTSHCFGREQSDLVVTKDVLLTYVVMSSKNIQHLSSDFGGTSAAIFSQL